jgi:hypothetical protein
MSLPQPLPHSSQTGGVKAGVALSVGRLGEHPLLLLEGPPEEHEDEELELLSPLELLEESPELELLLEEDGCELEEEDEGWDELLELDDMNGSFVLGISASEKRSKDLSGHPCGE